MLQKAKVVVVARLDPAALIVLETKKKRDDDFFRLGDPFGKRVALPVSSFFLSLSLSVLFRARRKMACVKTTFKRREEKEKKKVLLRLLPKI